MSQRGETEDGLGWGGLVASKAELREERRQAALEKDAARYRWLRRRQVECSPHVAIAEEAAERFDSAIDAAMAMTGK